MRGEMAISPLSLIIFGDDEGRNEHFSPHDLKSHKELFCYLKKFVKFEKFKNAST